MNNADKINKNNIIKMLLIMMLLLLVAIGISFAYFTANISGEETVTTITVTGGTMNIIYNGGANITVNNVYPKEEAWVTKNITITGNNTTNLEMFYNLSLIVTLNNFSYDALKYKLISTNSGGNGTIISSKTTMQDIGSGERTILLGYSSFTGPTSGNKVHTYKLEIYFPNTENNQNYNHGKTLNAYVSIKEGISNSETYLTDAILNQYSGSSSMIEASSSMFTSINAGTENAMYKMEDDYGTSFYYRGAKAHIKNSIIFAEHQWKIVRINGDGSIRLIYNGACPGNSCTINSTGTTTHMGISKYNTTEDDNKYVGYMYGGLEGVASTSRLQATTNETSSTIKTYLDSWYITNIQNKGYDSYISDTLFCNDRQLVGATTGTGFGKSPTNYAALNRLVSNKIPTLVCVQKNDRFTTTDTQVGNGALIYPIGLITADETAMAGLKYNTLNTTNYLYTGYYYYTLTPMMLVDDNIPEPYQPYTASVFYVYSQGDLTQHFVTNDIGVRGVINLKPNTLIIGTGSIFDPFIVQT